LKGEEDYDERAASAVGRSTATLKITHGKFWMRSEVGEIIWLADCGTCGGDWPTRKCN